MIPRLRPNWSFAERRRLLWPAPRGARTQFRAAFAQLVGQRYASTFSYGRMALYAYLKASGIQGKEILCPAYTCVVVAHAIEASGNRAVFVDISPTDLNMRFDLLRRAITPETAAVVLTSLYGNPVSLAEVAALRRDFPRLRMIQDCTHAIDGRHEGTGLAAAGDVAIFGLGITKPVTTVFGGVLTTDDAATHARVEALMKSLRPRRPEWRRSLAKRAYLVLSDLAFWPPLYRLTLMLERLGALNRFLLVREAREVCLPADRFEDLSAFEAGIGLLQLRKYPGLHRHHHDIAEVYRLALVGVNGARLLPVPANSHASHLNLLVEDRGALIRALRRKGAQLGQMYDYALPDLPVYMHHRFETVDRVATKVARQIVNLPLWVSAPEARRIATQVRAHLSALCGINPRAADPSRSGPHHEAIVPGIRPDPARSPGPPAECTPPGTV